MTKGDKLTKFFGSMALFAAGVLFGCLAMRNLSAPDNAQAADMENQRYVLQIDALNNKIDLLKNRIRNLENVKNDSRLAEHISILASPSSIPDEIEKYKEPPIHGRQHELKNLQAFKVEHQSEDFLNWYGAVNKNKINGVQVEMDNKFIHEETDYSWAREHEHKLNDLFSNNKYLTQFSVVANDCKSSLCRISIITPDSSQITQLPNSLSQEIYNTDMGEDLGAFISVVEPNSGLTHIYISRSDQDFQSLLQDRPQEAKGFE